MILKLGRGINNFELSCILGETSLPKFRPETVKEIEEIISSSNATTCILDPIHTKLLKLCKHEIAPVITQIVNLSLDGAEVPTSLKNAAIRPLLKKSSLDPNNFKNFRPVSNVPFLSKVIEKVVAKRLTTYLHDHSLLCQTQSAYKIHHSTETALLRVHTDITKALEQKKVAALLLLDLSAAFDTICHARLLNRLNVRYGICGKALSWFSSYLCDRQQFVTLLGSSSEKQALETGVPHGSVLGPLLFTLYVAPIENITKKHGIDSHFYADDSQLYTFFKPVDNQ